MPRSASQLSSPRLKAPPRSRRRRAWGLAGGALVALLAGLALLHGRRVPCRLAARAPAPPEDATEAGLRRSVEARPNDVEARLQLGRYEEGQGRPFEALWEYAEARRLAPADPRLPLHLAAVLRAAQAPDLAAPLLVETLRARPSDREARLQLADLYLAMAEPRQARSVMEAQRGTVWQEADAVLTLGRARQASGEDASARAAFQRALALDGKNDEAWYRLGRLDLRQGRIDQARDAFFHALLYQQRRPEYPFWAGMTYLRQTGPRSLERALGFFKDTLDLQSQYAPAQYEAGVALERMGRRSAALTHYSLATVADPSYTEPLPALSRALAAVGRAPDARRFRGRYHDLKDRPAAAMREYERMQAAAPDSGEPALLIGQLYLRTQRSEQAASVTEAALKRHPQDPELLERMSALRINGGDWPSARRLLQQWLALDPKASRPCWLMGRCGLGELKYAEAVGWLEKAVAREPRNPHYLGFLGAALLKPGTPAGRERAGAVLAQAVALAPDEAEYRELYGQALERLGQAEAARRQFLRALDLDPSRIAPYLAVSQLAWRLDRPGAAALFPTLVRSVQQRASEEPLLRRRVWQHPEDGEGRLKLAHFLCRAARLTRARDELEQAPAQGPASLPARELLLAVQRCLEVL